MSVDVLSLSLNQGGLCRRFVDTSDRRKWSRPLRLTKYVLAIAAAYRGAFYALPWAPVYKATCLDLRHLPDACKYLSSPEWAILLFTSCTFYLHISCLLFDTSFKPNRASFLRKQSHKKRVCSYFEHYLFTPFATLERLIIDCTNSVFNAADPPKTLLRRLFLQEGFGQIEALGPDLVHRRALNFYAKLVCKLVYCCRE